MIHSWKRSLRDGAKSMFDKSQKREKDQEALVSELYKQIGKLTVDLDFLSGRPIR
jgi:hypothetical protein